MAFDVQKVIGDIADDIKNKAQEMLDSSQIDDRVAHAFRSVADFLDVAAGRVDDLDTDETDHEGNPEPSVADETNPENEPKEGFA